MRQQLHLLRLLILLYAVQKPQAAQPGRGQVAHLHVVSEVLLCTKALATKETHKGTLIRVHRHEMPVQVCLVAKQLGTLRTLHLLTVEVDRLLVPIHVRLQREARGALGALEAGELASRHPVGEARPGAGSQVEREDHGESVLVDVLLQLLGTLKNPPAEATGQSLGEG